MRIVLLPSSDAAVVPDKPWNNGSNLAHRYTNEARFDARFWSFSEVEGSSFSDLLTR
jgi:hypothetical protein